LVGGLQMKRNDNFREYYDNLYRNPVKLNPAYKIYDFLRVRRIHELAKTAHGNGKCLIIGCGSRQDFAASPIKDIFAFDLSWEAARLIRADSENVWAADALSMPLPDSQFGLVICSEVLEHIPDIRSAIFEIRRVITDDGILIVSSPNWLSWFGLFRWIGEKITKKNLHSDDQPYDDWKTLSRYKKELWPEFKVIDSRGVWYLPPLHFRGHGIPSWLMKSIYWCFAPFEFLLSWLIPFGGHLLILRCRPNLDQET
jgi:SAM-dependent methyltransferase